VVNETVEITFPRSRACVVTVKGDQDRRTSAEMERLLSDLLAVSDLLVVDVSEADFVDSSFLRNVAIADRCANEQAKVFRLQMGTAPVVRRAFEVSGILNRLNVVDNRHDALAVPAAEAITYPRRA
jgi:anti-anti-sigma factor